MWRGLSERRHGSDPRIPLSSPDGRSDDAEVDTEPADERKRGGVWLWEEVTCVMILTSDLWEWFLNQIWFLHSVYWDFAITIRLEEIVYLHCHQHGEYKKYDLYIILKISAWICVKLSFISVDFQHHYCSLQGHMIFRNHNNMKHFWLLSMLKKLPRKSNFKFKT